MRNGEVFPGKINVAMLIFFFLPTVHKLSEKRVETVTGYVRDIFSLRDISFVFFASLIHTMLNCNGMFNKTFKATLKKKARGWLMKNDLLGFSYKIREFFEVAYFASTMQKIECKQNMLLPNYIPYIKASTNFLLYNIL